MIGFFSGISIWHFLFEYMDAVRVQNFPKVNSHWLNVYIFGFSLTYNDWGTIWSPQILPKSESIAALFVKFIPVKLREKSVKSYGYIKSDFKILVQKFFSFFQIFQIIFRSKRVFSVAGNLVTPNRNRLSPQQVIYKDKN